MVSDASAPTASTSAQALLSRFFGPPNVFANPQIPQDAAHPQPKAVADALLPAIGRFAKGFVDRPFLLPFASQTDEPVCWLACAHDQASAGALFEEMIAFVGPSFGEFEAGGAKLSPAGAVAKDQLSASGLHVVAFMALPQKMEPRILKAWQLYWQLLDQRPTRPRQELQSFNQLRAAFDRALVARNENDAKAAMAALRDQHGLSAENRAFLEIRIAAAFARWPEILSHPQWDDIVKVQLPPETYGDVWDALYQTHLAPIEAVGDADHLIRAFADHVRITATPLLKGRGRSRRPAALKGFLLHELSLQDPSAELSETLLAELGPQAFGAASAAIEARARALGRKFGLEQAIREMELERYEQAITLLEPLKDSVEGLQAQLRCAKEIGKPAHARDALFRIAHADRDIAAAVRATRARLIGDVEKLAEQEVRATLHDQLKTANTPAASDDVVVYWRELAQSSEASASLEQPGFVQSLATTIEDFAVDASPLFESLLPIWFDWLVIRTGPSSSLLSVYRAFLESLQVRDRAGESEREMIKLAARHSLLAGLTPADYRQLLDLLGQVFPSSPSPREVAWGIDVADLLMVQPCRDEEARLRWTTRIVQAGMQCASRLTAGDRALLQLLARESGIEALGLVLTQTEEEGQQTSDVDARIFLYSLDTQAIQRAALVLKSMLPRAKVGINSDETCTSQLRAGARNADWIVFVSGVATHQAFFCIKSSMRAEAGLLQVEGTGTTRIVERVLREARLAPTATRSSGAIEARNGRRWRDAPPSQL